MSLFFVVSAILVSVVVAQKPVFPPPPVEKDVRDYSEKDFLGLYDQWSADDDDEDDDSIFKNPPKLDPRMLSAKNNEEMSRIIKKNIPSSVVLHLRKSLSREEVTTATQIWVHRMYNNHIVVAPERVDEHEYKFVFADGSRVWDAKPFLLDREELVSVEIEGVIYEAKGAKLKAAQDEL